MPKFPNTLPFVAMNRTLRTESSVRDLDVEGTIPPESAGAFFRAVPDPAHAPMFDDDITLSADGMVSRFLFEGGQVDHDIKYVNTHRYAAERKARKALYGQYRNPYTDDPSVRDPSRPDLRTVANTTPVWHAGRLFMTKEDGRPYEINPHTLETEGYWDYEGKLKSLTLTAHPRIDPVTGEMFTYGYEAGGLATRDVAYVIIDKDGKLQSEQWFQVPYVAFDPRLRHHREVRHLPGVSDHFRPGAHEEGWPALGAPAGSGKLGGRDAPLRQGFRDALVQGTEGRVGFPHDQCLRRWRQDPFRCLSRGDLRLPVHA